MPRSLLPDLGPSPTLCGAYACVCVCVVGGRRFRGRIYLSLRFSGIVRVQKIAVVRGASHSTEARHIAAQDTNTPGLQLGAERQDTQTKSFYRLASPGSLDYKQLTTVVESRAAENRDLHTLWPILTETA